MYSIKNSNKILIDAFLLIIMFLAILFVVVFRWQKINFEIKEKEKELRISEIYNESFNELIDKTRKRQHEFSNHINAIFGMHMVAKTYDELVEMQKEYCNNIFIENKHSKILNLINNPALAGFVYTKIIEADEKQIDVVYNVSYEGKVNVISTYDLVEIIGILFDNAIEAIYDCEDVEQKIFLKLLDNDNQTILCIKN